MLVTFVIAMLVILVLVGLGLLSWLRVEGEADGEVTRLALRWTAFAAEVDLRSRSLDVRLFGWTMRRHDLQEDRPTEPRASRRRATRKRSLRAWFARIDNDWLFYRSQSGYLLRRVRLDRLEGALRVATPDPAITGILYGAACALAAPLALRFPRADVVIEPDFGADVPSGHLALALRVRLATLAAIGWRVFRHERSRSGGSPPRAVEKGSQDDGAQ